MSKEEFYKLVTVDRLPSDEEYKVIEHVYLYHPSISECNGKKDVAFLYNYFGMSVIYDMVQRANKAKEMQQRLFSLRGQITQLEEKLEMLHSEEFTSMIEN